MFSILAASIVFLLPHLCVARAPNGVANVTIAFAKANIVPKIIKSFTPTTTLGVNFTDPATADNVTAKTGSLLTTGQTTNEPHFSLGSGSILNIVQDPFPGLNPSYVVVMFDPDAPTPQMPNVSEALHFIGGNFTADSSGALTNRSAALVEYLAPAPPAGSDPHRYIAVVYNQPQDFDRIGPMFANSSTSRFNFSVTDFARVAKLQSPVAGNFFLVGPSSNSTTNSSSGAASTGSTSANSTGAASPTVSGATASPQMSVASGVPSLMPTSSAVGSPTSAPLSASAAFSWKVNAPLSILVSMIGPIILIITISM